MHPCIFFDWAASPVRSTLLWSGDHDGSIRLWDPAAGYQYSDPIRAHEDWISALTALSLPGGQVLLASGSNDGTIRLWDPSTGNQHGAQLRGHAHSITAIEPMPQSDGRILVATGSRDRTIRFWDLKKLACLTTMDICEPISAMVHLGGASVAVALSDGIAVIALPSGSPRP